jgi:hypothetical protein
MRPFSSRSEGSVLPHAPQQQHKMLQATHALFCHMLCSTMALNTSTKASMLCPQALHISEAIVSWGVWAFPLEKMSNGASEILGVGVAVVLRS